MESVDYNHQTTNTSAVESATPRLGTVFWPEALPEHTRTLLTYLADVMKKGEKRDDNTALITLEDLETLKQGLEYLGIKIYALANNMVHNLPKEERAQFKSEEWYMNHYTRYDDSENVMITDQLPAKKKKQKNKKSGPRRPTKKTAMEMRLEELDAGENEFSSPPNVSVKVSSWHFI